MTRLALAPLTALAVLTIVGSANAEQSSPRIALGHPDPMWSRPPYEPQAAPELAAPWQPASPPAWDGSHANAPVLNLRGHLALIASHKSEAEAQAAIRALRRAFPMLLTSKPPHIGRANGTFYGAVGPFASAGEATAFCNGLKAAGGQCSVQNR